MWCLIGDVHFGVRDRRGFFFETQQRILSSILDLAQESRVEAFIFLGDIFDKRGVVKTSHALFFLDLLKKLGDYGRVVIISGNHDFLHRDGVRTFLETYEPYAEVVMSPRVINLSGVDVFCCPWTQGEEVLLKPADFMFGHLGLSEFSYIKNPFFEQPGTDEVPVKGKFSQYRRVVLGHYHQFQERGNITYLGSICHLTWNDLNVPKYLGLLDPGTGELQLVDTLRYHSQLFGTLDWLEENCPPGSKWNLMLDGPIPEALSGEVVSVRTRGSRSDSGKKETEFVENLEEVSVRDIIADIIVSKARKEGLEDVVRPMLEEMLDGI